MKAVKSISSIWELFTDYMNALYGSWWEEALSAEQVDFAWNEFLQIQ